MFGIADHDGELLTNDIVYLLERPSEVQDTSWIKPGKVAWDWWNDWNVDGVDFKAGINTKTYEYYVDFAAKYGIPYIILDDGWYKLGNLLEVTPELNMQELIDYAKQKNVGLILWASWKTLDDQLIPALDQFEKWGVKGIKVDFMQRSDQIMIDYFYSRMPGGGEAAHAGGFPRGSEARSDDAHLAEPDQHRRRARHGVEQVERGVGTEAQRHAAVHSHVPGADGLHAGGDAQCNPLNVPAD